MDDFQMEKVTLDSEFTHGIDFGIQETQVLAGNELNKFLLSDPNDVKTLEQENKDKEESDRLAKEKEEKEKAEKEKQSKQQQNQIGDKSKEKLDKQEQGKQALDGLLFGEENEDDADNNENKNQNQNNQNQQNQTQDDDTYSTLSKDLLRLGVFSQLSDEETEETIKEAVKTPEQFLERFSLEKKRGAVNILEQFLGQFGEDYRKMFDAVFANGVKPDEYLQSITKIDSISNVDLAVEDNQVKVLKNYYRGLKWDDQKIEARIQKLRDYGDLEDEAKTYHEVILNKEKEQLDNLVKAKEAENQKIKEKEENTKKSYQTILNNKLKDQEIDGVPLTQKDAQEVYKYMVDKPYKLPTGELLSEFDKDLLDLNKPENHELKIKLGLLLKKKLDLTAVKKTTISKKSDTLFTLATKNSKQQEAKNNSAPKSFF
jgi:hypothetical protein